MLDKCILKLEKPCAKELLAYYKNVFEIEEAMISEYQDKVHETVNFLEETLVWLKKLCINYSLFKKQVLGMIQIKQNQLEYQKQIISTLHKYEH